METKTTPQKVKLKTFRVTFEQSIFASIDVEAADAASAEEIALELYLETPNIFADEPEEDRWSG